MSRFLKLTKIIINANQIRIIDFNQPNKYNIHLVAKEIYGWTIFGTGSIESYEPYITVCQEKDQEDYKIVSEWIEKL
jgi:hypothetical protein